MTPKAFTYIDMNVWMGQELLHEPLPAPHASLVQGGLPIVIHSVDLCAALLDEQLDQIDATDDTGVMQGRQSTRIPEDMCNIVLQERLRTGIVRIT